MRYQNKTGVTGVSTVFYYEAKICIDREQVLLKKSRDFFEAVCARKSAEAKLTKTTRGGYTK